VRHCRLVGRTTVAHRGAAEDGTHASINEALGPAGYSPDATLEPEATGTLHDVSPPPVGTGAR
jgi:hypothetical protein